MVRRYRRPTLDRERPVGHAGRMTPERLRDLCLALPQSIETFPFGAETSVFKTEGNGKIFALAGLADSPLTVSVKCDPEDAKALRSDWEEITPGYHLNKKHWITVDLTGTVPDDLVEDLVTDSHALVQPRMPRAPSSR